MIEVRRLRILRELADHGTVAAAAAALHLTPSAVSQQLAVLTREAGVPLLEPAGRRLRLTPAARTLLEHAHRVFAVLEEAEADLARHAEGRSPTIRIGGFPTAILALVAPVARELREDPSPVVVHAVEAEERRVFARLASGELDIALSVEFAGAPQQDGPRFHRSSLLTDVMDVALPTGHPLADRLELDLGALAGEPWVLGTPGTSCHDIVTTACAVAGFTPRAVHTTSDWAAVGALVADGDAVALVPRLAQRLLPERLVVRPLRGALAARHVFAATRRGQEAAPTVARTLDRLRDVAAGYAVPVREAV